MRTPCEVAALSEGVIEFAPRTIHASYRWFVSHFKGPLWEEKVFQGAYMVYGWMPTMLKLKGPPEVIFETAQAARDGVISADLLQKCAKTLNNSIVGTSKLIHFISPEAYPIWDSRVYRTLYLKSPHTYRLENAGIYMNYIEWCKEFQALEGFSTIKDRFEEESGYSVSNMRVAEAVCYALGPRPKKKKQS